MRLQVFPGIRFWHNFALFGLLVIPVFMYAFLFGFLEITEHDALIYIYGVLTTALVLGNAWSGAILPGTGSDDPCRWNLCLYVSCNIRNLGVDGIGGLGIGLCHLSGSLQDRWRPTVA